MGDGPRLARAAFGLGREFTAGSVDELEIGLLEETLAVLGEADSTLRARVLARLARALASSPDADRRAALSQAAVAMAERMGDPVSLAAVLYEHHMATWGPDNLRERLAVATEVVQLAEAAGDRVMALRGRGFLLANQLEQGDLAALGRGLEDYDRAAQALGQLHFAWHVPLFRAGQELLAGRLDEAERLAAEALALGRRAHDPLVVIYHTIVLVGLRWQQGRLPELEATLRRFVDRFPANLGWRATLAVLLCEAGRRDEAREHVERLAADEFAGLPRNHLYLYHLAILAIACSAHGDRRRAARLYDLLLPYADRNVIVARLPLGTLGSASQHLGLLAATLSNWDPAAAPFTAAMQAHERTGAAPFLAAGRAEHARALRAGGRRRDWLGEVLLGDPGDLAPLDGDPERVGDIGREVAGELGQRDRGVLGRVGAGGEGAHRDRGVGRHRQGAQSGVDVADVVVVGRGRLLAVLGGRLGGGLAFEPLEQVESDRPPARVDRLDEHEMAAVLEHHLLRGRACAAAARRRAGGRRRPAAPGGRLVGAAAPAKGQGDEQRQHRESRTHRPLLELDG